MLNRVINGGKVYYRVADLAKLFDVTEYSMKKAIKTNKLEKTLKGFGRVVFVLEENVALIDVRGKTATVKTEIIESVDKMFQPVEKKKKSTKKAKAKEKPVEVKKVEKEPAKKEEEIVGQEPSTNNENVDSIEMLQKEHADLLGQSNGLFIGYLKNKKSSLLHEICEKHMGKGNQFVDGTLEELPAMRSVIAELQSTATKMQLSL